MREIKFRQWHNKHWHYFEFTDGKCSGVVSASLSNSPIMQYTGLLDKNGKEIYEGDIVKDDRVISVVEFGKIGYDGSWNGLTGFALKEWHYDDEGGFYELKYYFDASELEIVGNIYENRENC